ncbi:hypothetical protein [Streptomyces sp. NPDC060075]|uniref:hypothetical protein n=1 Tax=Streptomyces sp. NPDC060075 TaxID=3347051 RepID=UPI003664BDD3
MCGRVDDVLGGESADPGGGLGEQSNSSPAARSVVSSSVSETRRRTIAQRWSWAMTWAAKLLV